MSLAQTVEEASTKRRDSRTPAFQNKSVKVKQAMKSKLPVPRWKTTTFTTTVNLTRERPSRNTIKSQQATRKLNEFYGMTTKNTSVTRKFSQQHFALLTRYFKSFAELMQMITTVCNVVNCIPGFALVIAGNVVLLTKTSSDKYCETLLQESLAHSHLRSSASCVQKPWICCLENRSSFLWTLEWLQYCTNQQR